MNNLKITLYAILLLCISIAGCSEKSNKAAAVQTQQTAMAHFDSIQKIVAQTAQTYHAMDNPTLLRNLVAQSKSKKEPFNSLAYRELKNRKDINADTLAGLVRELKNSDALLPLILLRKTNNEAYLKLPVELRAEVLTDALRTSKTFNTWGLPHLYLEDASRAMLESGKSTEAALKRMLGDTRPAPVFGSKEYMEYLKYKYRLCDYALFFLEKIQGNEKFVMPLAVAERDSMIRDIMK